MTATNEDCIQIKIKEKQPFEWSPSNQIVVKFNTTEDKDNAESPESDKSPMISPTRPSCLKNPWNGNSKLNRTLSSSSISNHKRLNGCSNRQTCVSDVSYMNFNMKNQMVGRENNSMTTRKFQVTEVKDLQTNQPTSNLRSSEGNLPTILISNEFDTENQKYKSLHESLPDIAVKVDKADRSNAVLTTAHSDIEVHEKEKSIEEDHKNLLRLISNLQNVAESISTKYGKEDSIKSNKQLNFRAQDDVISVTKDLLPIEFLKPKKEYRFLTKPETKRSDDFSFYFRNKNRPESNECESSQLILETERLIDNKTNGICNIRWSDANSVTSPCSIGPESPFESGRKNRSQNIIYPRRSVLKNGECNVLKKSSKSKRRIRYLQDIFTTLVDVKWRWTLVVFALSFLMSWLFYAGLYWLVAYAHGDFEHLEDENWTPCVENLINFASCFLFSVETQHTIGYGGRATTEVCPEAIFIMCIQSITGVMISAFMAGIFFAKMARPKQRRQTLLFSRKAVVCQRDAQMCLMFRVGDMRKSHIIGTNIRAHIFRSRFTREGEELPQYQCELQVAADGCESNLFFIWPLTVVHVIDKDSPFYTMSAQELLQENFEVVAILEGTVESTGQTTQARTSYLPNEIKWGHRFESILSYNMDRQCYEIDYKKFNNTVKVATPLCSAKDLDELFMVQSEICDYNVMTSDPDTDIQ